MTRECLQINVLIVIKDVSNTMQVKWAIGAKKVFCGLYYKLITIVNDDSRVVSK